VANSKYVSMNISFNSMILGASIFAALVASATAQCIGTETNICMTVNVFSSETGYYELDRGDFEPLSGPSPDISVKINDVITFDQTDITNWYHPVGFAYRADGAHGDDWGAAENDEVEGLGELQYYINVLVPECDDAGDTGLDCYEPEFFYPRQHWVESDYAAILTITPEVAANSIGGVIYYFCHIHSKMSGKIIITDYEGDTTTEVALYEPVVNDEFDENCGTSGVSVYANDGDNSCEEVPFFGGEIDNDFEKCLQAIDCQMHWEMFSQTGVDGSDKIVTFMQQMIPHHNNAVNMAKILLKFDKFGVDSVEELEDILYSIINEQNFQVHYFRNYLNDGNLLDGDGITPPAFQRRLATCEGSETNVCMTVNVFSSETGYYELDRGDFEPLVGSSPDISVKIGDVITFDQSDITNWYHPVGFAYRADGAHGDDWGAAENDEVEGLGQLQYYINGLVPECDDAGDTGLDCYEPEFFYPRAEWVASSYKATLTITQEVADASIGGVIYYFCHIHSKMSGKIIITDAVDSSDESFSSSDEQDLYEPVVNDEFDTKCGTTGISEYQTGGAMGCDVEFFGDLADSDFKECLQAIDCQMFTEMNSETTADGDDPVVTFMQQMIPHHINAVNMAKLVLKMSSQEELDAVEDFEGGLYWIINAQNYQIHFFRNYLNPDGNYLGGESEDDNSGNSDSENNEDGSPDVCFSPIATASVNGKGRIMMKDLVNGDSVLTMDGSYQTMYSMNHYHKSKETIFVQIRTNLESEQPLELSPNHLLYVADSINPVPASTVEVGDKVWTIEGGKEVLEINMITRDGLYNPLTMDGTIVVDGIVASAYTTPTGKTHLEIDGVWSKMMKSLSFHDALHMVSAPYRQFCNTVSLDLCNMHEKESAASSFMKSFFFPFWSNQNSFVKFIIASSYVLVFGTLANLTYFKVWILLVNACAFFVIPSKMTMAK